MKETSKQQFQQIPTRNLYQKRLMQVLLLIIGCITLGLIDGFRSYTGTYNNGTFNGHFYSIMRWDVVGWLAWIAFIPLILRLCKRFPIDRNIWQKSLLLFIPIGLLTASIRTLFPIPFHIVFFGGFEHLQSWLPNKFYILITDFIIAFSFYLLILSLGQARNYYKRYREEELRASQLEAQLSKAELQALKMQLHPHFLFNVLNSIAALQFENPKAAQEMTVRLGDFLRMTLENVGVQEVTLEKEVEMLKCYLDIEQIRFGEQLTTNIDISPDTYDCQIPNLLLQPIVENAIRHGIAPLVGNGKIDIKAVSEKGWLKLEVKDNGQGIENTDNIFSSGVGLSNTHARLEQSYGDNFQFNCESKHGNGMLVTLRLPFKKTQ